jgi:hypothetical protein
MSLIQPTLSSEGRVIDGNLTERSKNCTATAPPTLTRGSSEDV